MIWMTLRFMKYFVVWPLVIISIALLWHEWPVIYQHERQVFLARMVRIHAKDQAKKAEADMIELSRRVLPPMPVGGL